MFVKSKYTLPVDEEYKKFCDFMGYEFLYERGGFYYYFIPPGHICRFKINYKRWTAGSFNKEKFLASIK
jgi:hypothetical protein